MIALLTLAVMVGTAFTPTRASAETWSVTLNLDWNDFDPYDVHAVVREYNQAGLLLHTTDLTPNEELTEWTGTITDVNTLTAYAKVAWVWGQDGEHWRDPVLQEDYPPWKQFTWTWEAEPHAEPIILSVMAD